MARTFRPEDRPLHTPARSPHRPSEESSWSGCRASSRPGSRAGAAQTDRQPLWTAAGSSRTRPGSRGNPTAVPVPWDRRHQDRANEVPRKDIKPTARKTAVASSDGYARSGRGASFMPVSFFWYGFDVATVRAVGPPCHVGMTFLHSHRRLAESHGQTSFPPTGNRAVE